MSFGRIALPSIGRYTIRRVHNVPRIYQGSVKRLLSGKSDSADIKIDSGGTAHIVWMDLTSGNAEIYCKTGN